MTNTMSMHDQILDRAQGYIQKRGYNGFSFRDIASDIGIKSSSIHYYYPSKTDLAVAVATKYRADFLETTNELLNSQASAKHTLLAYADLFQATLKSENRLCLCGMLASELNSVDPQVRSEVKAFFLDQCNMLTEVISRGQSKGTIRAEIHAADFAKTYLAALEGAMMLARTNEMPSEIELVARQILELI